MGHKLDQSSHPGIKYWDPAITPRVGGAYGEELRARHHAEARLSSPGTAAVFTGEDAEAGRDGPTSWQRHNL